MESVRTGMMISSAMTGNADYASRWAVETTHQLIINSQVSTRMRCTCV